MPVRITRIGPAPSRRVARATGTRQWADDGWNYAGPRAVGGASIEAAGGRRGGATIHHAPSAMLAGAQATMWKARHAYFNNGYIRRALDAIVTACCGAGPMTTPQHPDATVRAALSAHFGPWGLRCDADGGTDLAGLIAAILRDALRDGDVFVHLIPVQDGRRLLLRIVPSEAVDFAESRALPNGGQIVAGVEFDANGTRVAYWVREPDPSASFDSYRPARRILATDLLHVREILSAGQVRGLSRLAAALVRAGELDQLQDAALVGVKVSAMHLGVIVDPAGAASDPFDGPIAHAEPGTMIRLPGGLDVRWNAPAQVSQTAAFIASEIRAIATALGVPSFIVSGDLSEANFSSLRAGLQAFRAEIERLFYTMLVPQLLRPIWERWVTLSFLAGDLDDLGAPALDDLLPAEFLPPAQPWIDPKADIAAIREAMAAGIMSRRQAVASQGWNIEALDAEIAADRERERALGIGPFPIPANGQPAAEAPEITSDESPADDQEPET
ncbi:phage portal protein, lambda family [Roseomonas rosea]|uniref:Phage portal protein, lambda family n=1 Tax=Muricoccus roseus TaxID=198092 RepID=A0A1M6Q0A4_9PROT|nr:phage portal protein [Roseomonas rosea]SHK13665.1 phage portal protein, lambda family [Roseomonas rosea]